MNKFVKNIPNIITTIRILGAIAIIFLEPFSLPFYIIYGACGITDGLDGLIARKFHLESRFGSILDSVSDLIFLGIMGVKIIPVLIGVLPLWTWIIIWVPFGLHMLGYIVCAIKFHTFSALHTYANKLLSVGIFFYPFTFIGWIHWIYDIYAIVFGSVAIYSSVELNLIHILSKEYDDSNKSIFLLIKKEHKETVQIK